MHIDHAFLVSARDFFKLPQFLNKYSHFCFSLVGVYNIVKFFKLKKYLWLNIHTIRERMSWFCKKKNQNNCTMVIFVSLCYLPYTKCKNLPDKVERCSDISRRDILNLFLACLRDNWKNCRRRDRKNLRITGDDGSKRTVSLNTAGQ